ncbi:hypothetical protein L1049_011485 [Liquidambar formosana]|uniref:Uncharacterized protein n=1 Tax=Liquidambar formosana TaxID=63359 RepID=A0AAP0RX48_LIQFO
MAKSKRLSAEEELKFTTNGEHQALEIANQVKNLLETYLQHKPIQSSWEMVKDLMVDADNTKGIACRKSRKPLALLEAAVPRSPSDNLKYEQNPVQ